VKRLCAAALVVAAAPMARAEDFSGRATAGYNQVRSAEQHTDTFAQIYDLRYERPVTEVILYRLSLRAEDDLGTALIEGVRVDHETRELRPVLHLQWNRPEFSLQLGYDLTWAQALTDGVSSDSRLLQHGSVVTAATPGDVSIIGDLQWRAEKQDDTVDNTELRGSFLASLQKRELTLSGGGNATHYRDPLHDFSRLGVGLLGSVAWTDTFGGGKATVALSNTAQWNLQQEESRTGLAAEQARRELPTAALHAIDDTPLDSRDLPLQPVPALLDADLATPTAVDLGPLGVDHQALGVDLGRFLTVDELRVHVRSEQGNTVPRGGDILFDVYTSLDGREWRLHEGAPAVAFLLTSSTYAVRFPFVNTRYVKLVTFGVNSLDTRVTEVEVFSHAVFTPLEDRVSHTFVDSVQVGFTHAPVKPLLLSYTGLFNFNRLSDDRSEEDVTGLDWLQTCTLTLRVTRWLETQVGAENRRAMQLGELTGSWNTLSAMVTTTPVPTITATARATTTLAVEPGGNSNNQEARLALYTRFLPSLDSSLDVGVGRQTWELPLERRIDRQFVSWLGNAQLFRPLRLTGNVAMQRSEATGDEMVGPAVGKDYRAYGEANLRASQQLLLAARIGWAEGSGTSGVIQRYRVDWHPFPGGAIVFGFSYDQDQQSTTGYKSQRIAVFPSWIVNRHMILNLNYTRIELSGPERTRENEIFYVLLTLNT
jgi:hypothetical protein